MVLGHNTTQLATKFGRVVMSRLRHNEVSTYINLCNGSCCSASNAAIHESSSQSF